MITTIPIKNIVVRKLRNNACLLGNSHAKALPCITEHDAAVSEIANHVLVLRMRLLHVETGKCGGNSVTVSSATSWDLGSEVLHGKTTKNMMRN